MDSRRASAWTGRVSTLWMTRRKRGSCRSFWRDYAACKNHPEKAGYPVYLGGKLQATWDRPLEISPLGLCSLGGKSQRWPAKSDAQSVQAGIPVKKAESIFQPVTLLNSVFNRGYIECFHRNTTRIPAVTRKKNRPNTLIHSKYRGTHKLCAPFLKKRGEMKKTLITFLSNSGIARH